MKCPQRVGVQYSLVDATCRFRKTRVAHGFGAASKIIEYLMVVDGREDSRGRAQVCQQIETVLSCIDLTMFGTEVGQALGLLFRHGRRGEVGVDGVA